MKNYSNYNFIHEAELYENVNKNSPEDYHPFFIKALTPLESEVGRVININRNNIMNKDLTWLSTQPIISERTIDLVLPKFISSGYPDEIIPKGTKFLVCFVGGNINNCQIIGRCF